jgi:hypothetical protein
MYAIDINSITLAQELRRLCDECGPGDTILFYGGGIDTYIEVIEESPCRRIAVVRRKEFEKYDGEKD